MANTRSSGGIVFLVISALIFLPGLWPGSDGWYAYLLFGLTATIAVGGLLNRIPAGRAAGLLWLMGLFGGGINYLFSAGETGYGMGGLALFILIFLASWSESGLKLLKRLAVFTLFICTLGGMVWANFEGESTDFPEEEYTGEYAEEEPVEEIQTENTEENPLQENEFIRHARRWKVYSGKRFRGELKVGKADAREARSFRRSRLSPDLNAAFDDYWGEIYRRLMTQDREAIHYTADNLLEISKKRKLNRKQTANMIVSCVQNIPYTLIHRYTCEKYTSSSKAARELHDANVCRPESEFGILSPVEFMAELKGDCDTRTVLLFLLLDRMGYKTVILNSENYGHSMLGIDLPFSGKYKRFRGVKYYFWETTAENWEPGMLPPDMSNTAYWHPVVYN